QELQTVNCRWASAARRSTSDNGGCLSSGDSAEDGPDRHTEAGQVTAEENVPGHDLPGCEEVFEASAGPMTDARCPINLYPQVGEGDSGAQRVGIVGRAIDRPRPMALGQAKALGVAVVEDLGIEGPANDRGIEVLDRLSEGGGI